MLTTLTYITQILYILPFLMLSDIYSIDRLPNERHMNELQLISAAATMMKLLKYALRAKLCCAVVSSFVSSIQAELLTFFENLRILRINVGHFLLEFVGDRTEAWPILGIFTPAPTDQLGQARGP
jgi:hypothetical protein